MSETFLAKASVLSDHPHYAIPIRAQDRENMFAWENWDEACSGKFVPQHVTLLHCIEIY